jgi:hypothetical protein
MSNSFNQMLANCVNGSSVIILEGGETLKELSFSSGKANLKDLQTVFSMRGWTQETDLYFLPIDDEFFVVIGNDEILAIVSKAQSELFRGQKHCECLTQKDVLNLKALLED